ncbi:MAG: hypothetical protein KDC79_05330 [Cyclobacteriaceae bacterium]|nr:hypothetical protein [Cyclobacteriaceae bacterium]
MDVWVIILFVVVVLHFIAGFGYLMYKLSPKKKDDSANNDKLDQSQSDPK